jgi:hypothetical protein
MKQVPLRIAYACIVLFHLTFYFTSLYTRWRGIMLGQIFDYMLTSYSLFVLVVTGFVYYHWIKAMRTGKERTGEIPFSS